MRRGLTLSGNVNHLAAVCVVLSVALSSGTALVAYGREKQVPKREYVVGTGFAHGDGRYHLFYDTQDNASPTSGGGYRIAYAYSEDGLHWIRPALGLVQRHGSKENNLLDLPRGPKGSWNDVMMCSSGAFYQPNKWRMWVAGYYGDAGGALHAQMDCWESPDPIHWESVGERPAVTNGPEGSFDWGFARVPCVIKDGGMFRMYYTAGDGKGGWFVGYAESPDGRQWIKPRLGVCAYAGSKVPSARVLGKFAPTYAAQIP